MATLGKTGIPYADYGWPLVTGCSNAGPACDHCYAARYAATRGKHLPQYAGLASLRYEAHIDCARGTSTERTFYGWTGEVRFHPELLDGPLHTKKPGRVFTVPTGDLFHEGVTTEQIAEAFGVMAVARSRFVGNYPRNVFYGPHEFIVVTKRMPRVHGLLTSFDFRTMVAHAAFRHAHNRIDAGYLCDRIQSGKLWPLPNVTLLPTVWDQESADRVIPLLLDAPAAVRGISLEPMLGPVDLEPFTSVYDEHGEPSSPLCNPDGSLQLSWVVLGGETGPGARRMHASWAVDVWKQCKAAGVPFYWKQAGSAWLDGDGTDDDDDAAMLDCRELPAVTL